MLFPALVSPFHLATAALHILVLLREGPFVPLLHALASLRVFREQQGLAQSASQAQDGSRWGAFLPVIPTKLKSEAELLLRQWGSSAGAKSTVK